MYPSSLQSWWQQFCMYVWNKLLLSVLHGVSLVHHHTDCYKDTSHTPDTIIHHNVTWQKCKDHNLLHLHCWRTTTGGLVEQSVLDNLSQHSVENFRGDLAGVCRGFGEFVFWLLVRAIITKNIGSSTKIVVPCLQLISKIINLKEI